VSVPPLNRQSLDAPPRGTPLARCLVWLVRVYQAAGSAFFGRQCKYVPTCSQYMIDALRERGALTGLALGLWRVLRCNPFSRGGYDPVPPRHSH
jgi:putative membrane protein insertion efficiency factor